MMISRRLIISAVAACTVLFAPGVHSGWWPFSSDEEAIQPQTEITQIMWDDLIPDDFVQPDNPFSTMSEEEIDKIMDGSEESEAELARLQAEFNYAPVVDELNGKRVKIPAYITPLEFDGQSKLSEFLLVPYVGACMHTPPPPSNQIVHAKLTEAIEMKSMYDPVWAIGILRTETVKSDLAESGYRLEVEQVLPYSRE